MDAGRYAARLRPFYEGRRLILTGAPLAALLHTSRQVRALGADPPFLLAMGTGTGPSAVEDDGERYVLKVEAPDIVSETRQELALLADLPAEALKALDRYDPDRRAVVLSPPMNELPLIAGRRVYARRLPSWRKLEDKTVVDELWDACGVRRPPSEVVPADADALVAAARRLDRGLGTVWAGDTREGLNGGAIYLRWVRGREDAAEAMSFLSARCDRARVMPFVEGIPCSIHGMVLPEGVAAFRPVEMVTLRKVGSNRLLYAGAATFWDPVDEDREAMRRLARVVGAALRDRIGYRGAFTVDGVMSADGFLPTELNTRFGTGLVVIGESCPELPLWLLNLAVVEDEPLDVRPAGLEADLLGAADRVRSGGAWTTTREGPAVSRRLPVVFTPGDCRVADPEERPDGTVWFGPSNVGGFVKLELDPEQVPTGPSVAPLAVSAFALADECLGSGIGPHQPSRPARYRDSSWQESTTRR